MAEVFKFNTYYTYTAPAFLAYYTSAGTSTAITAHAATDAVDLFTIDNLKGDFTVSYDNGDTKANIISGGKSIGSIDYFSGNSNSTFTKIDAVFDVDALNLNTDNNAKTTVSIHSASTAFADTEFTLGLIQGGSAVNIENTEHDRTTTSWHKDEGTDKAFFGIPSDEAYWFDSDSNSSTKDSYTYHAALSAIDSLAVDGVTDITGFDKDDTDSLILNVAGFNANGATLTNNDGGFKLTLTVSGGSADGKSFYGLSTADTIDNYVDKIAIYGLSGNDIIGNYGDSAFIDGGADNDIINLLGGDNAIVNVSEGDDTINVSGSIASFTVEGFSAGDVINFQSNISGLSMVSGVLNVSLSDGKTVAISGLSLAENVQQWNFIAGRGVYVDATLAGGYSKGSQILFKDKPVLGDTLIAIEGVNGVDHFASVDSDNIVSLGAENFGQSVALTYNAGNSYAFYLTGALSGIDSANFYGTNEDDQIGNFGVSNIAIYGGSGADYIGNEEGNNVEIYGGSGNDSIGNGGNNVEIYGGSGNDEILNVGNSVIINGGLSNDIVSLLGGDNVTVNVSQGDDTIYVDASEVTSFSVSGFSTGDVINFQSNISGLSMVNGVLNVSLSDGKTVAISGLSLSENAQQWNFIEGRGVYVNTTLAGGYSEGSQILFKESALGDTLIAIDGINGVDHFTPADSRNIVSLGAENFGSSVAIRTNADNYMFAITGALSGIDSVSFYGLSTADTIGNYADNIAIYGLSGADYIANYGSNVTIDCGTGEDIIYNKGSEVNINGGSGNDKILNVGNSVIINGGLSNDIVSLRGGNNVTVNVSEGDDTIYVDAAEVNAFSVSGFSTGDVIQFTDSISGLSMVISGVLNVELSDGKTVAISGISSIYQENGGWSYATASSISYSFETIAGAVFNGSTQLTFNGSASSIKLFTINGLSTSTGLELNGNTVNVSASALDGIKHDVTINKGYIFSLSGVSAPADFTGWKLDSISGIATYVTAAKTDGYTLAGDSTIIDYLEEVSGKKQIELGGVIDIKDFGFNGNIARLNTSGFSSIVSVISNKGYEFHISGSEKDTLKSFYATNDDDKIELGGAQMAVYGLSGNDYIYAGNGGHTTIDAGEGNNTVRAGGEGYNVIFTGSGKDSISVIGGGHNTIDAGGGDNTIYASGVQNYIIGLSGADFISLSNGGNTIDAGDGANTIYANGDSNYITVGSGADFISISGGYNSIDAGDGDNTIYASGVQNYIIGLSGADFISVGSGNSIDAGDGANTIYANGDSNYITVGSGADFISLNGGYNSIDAGDGDNTIYANGGNHITVGSGADFISLNGSGNRIDAGLGADFINLNGSGNNNISLGADSAADTISVGASVEAFTVTDFGINDVIDFNGVNVNELTVNGNVIIAELEGGRQVSIGGLSKSETVQDWNAAGTSATFGEITNAGAIVNGTKLAYQGASAIDFFKLSGVSAKALTNVGISGTSITLTESILDLLGDGESIELTNLSGNYSLSSAVIDDDTAKEINIVTAAPDAEDTKFVFNGGNSFTFTSAYTPEYFLLAGNSITRHNETDKVTFTINGLSNFGLTAGEELTVDDNGVIKSGNIEIGTISGTSITLYDAALPVPPQNIIVVSDSDKDFTLTIGNYAMSAPAAANYLINDNGSYTYKANYIGEHFAANDPDYEEVKASYTYNAEHYDSTFALSGAALSAMTFDNSITDEAINSYLTINGDVVTLKDSIMKQPPTADDDLTISNGYKLTNPNPIRLTQAEGFYAGGTSTVNYNLSSYDDGYEGDGSTWTYQNAVNGETAFALNGLPDFTNYNFSINEGNITAVKGNTSYTIGTFSKATHAVTLEQNIWTELDFTPETVSMSGSGTLKITKDGEPVTVAEEYDDTRENFWKTEGTTAAYYLGGLSEAWTSEEDNSYTFHAEVADETLAVITGIKAGSDFSTVTPSASGVITISKEFLPEIAQGTKIELEGEGYTLAIGAGISSPVKADPNSKGEWIMYEPTRATYYAPSTTDGYALSNNNKTLSYVAATTSDADFELVGLSGISATYLNENVSLSGITLTLTQNFLPTADNPLKLISKNNNQYDIVITNTDRIFTDETEAVTAAGFSGTGGTYTYTSEHSEDYYLKTIGKTTTIASKAGKTATTFKISGLAETLGELIITADGKVIGENGITVGTISDKTITITNRNALAKGTVKLVNEDYTLALDIEPEIDEGKFTSVSDGTAIYKTASFSNYENTATNEFTYQTTVSDELTISGLNPDLNINYISDLISVEEGEEKTLTVTFKDTTADGKADALNYTADNTVKLTAEGYTIKIGNDSVTNAKTKEASWQQTGVTSYKYSVRSISEHYTESEIENGIELTYNAGDKGLGDLIALNGLDSIPSDQIAFDTTNKVITFNEQIGNNIVVTSTGNGANDYVLNFEGKDFGGMAVTATGNEDTINIKGDRLNIYGGAGNDSITAEGDNVNINGGDGNDSLNVEIDNSYINGDAGDDSIEVKGTNLIISGGTGSDSINITGGSNVSIDAGAGGDSINFNADNGIIFFSAGSDTINYSTNYSIKLRSTITSYDYDGNDAIITCGNDSLRVLNGAGNNIKIITADGLNSVITDAFYKKRYLTYNLNNTAVTLNGSVEAAAYGKYEFNQPSLTANEYYPETTSIKASDSLSKPVYIQGNAKSNYITSNANGNSLDGGAGNDLLFSGDGADTFVFRANQGDDVIYRFKTGKDSVKLLTADGQEATADDFTTTFDSTDIVFRINDGSGKITIKNVFDSATSITTTVNGAEYTYLKEGAIVKDGKVTIANGITTYTVTDADKANGLTITNYSAGIKLQGITLNDIKTTSYANKAIILGLGDASINLQSATTNELNLNGTTLYVGENMFFDNADESAATNFTLTAGNTVGLDKLDASDNIKVDGSRATVGVTLQGGSGNDTLIDGANNDSLTGNGGADIFVYRGGNDTIADYTPADDVISLAANDLLDFSNVTFNEDNVIINGTDGNALTIVNGADQKITVVDKNGNVQEYSYKSAGNDGTLNDDETSITLPANSRGFDANEKTYPNLATIDASAVTNAIAVKARDTNASYLIAGDTGLSLTGGNKNDTFKSGNGNSTLTGGTGTDVFVHEGGNDVVTDYTTSERDKVSLASGDMGDVTGVTVGADNTRLTFEDGSSIELQNIASGASVTFASASDTYGSTYQFENDKVKYASGRGVTLTGANANYTIGSGEQSVIVNNGGTITGGTQKATLGGNKNVSIVAGEGAEVFLYKGGSMTVSGFASADKISLASGYTVQSNELDETVFTLTVSNGTDTGFIIIEDVEESSLPTLKVNSNGIDRTINIPYASDDPIVFNNDNKRAATQVTLVSANNADFGVFSENETEPSTLPGTEYYTSLVTITAQQENVTIVGNAKANTFNITGGEKNIITGGLGKDVFNFKSSSGIITDFGIGSSLTGGKKVCANSTTKNGGSYTSYNRDNPLSYAQGVDSLKAEGTVVEIAFKQDSATDVTTDENSFTAYVTYDSNGDNTGDYTIALANIAKKVTKYDTTGNGANAVYETNATAAAKLKIWDTSSGTSAQLTGTALSNLFVDKSNAQYSNPIGTLDNLIKEKEITIYETTDNIEKITSVSNGIVAAYNSKK